MLIRLQVEFEKGDVKRQREVLLPAGQFAVEDWFAAGTGDKSPNICKVSYAGNSYKVKQSRHDLEIELESAGVKIYGKKAA